MTASVCLEYNFYQFKARQSKIKTEYELRQYVVFTKIIRVAYNFKIIVGSAWGLNTNTSTVILKTNFMLQVMIFYTS